MAAAPRLSLLLILQLSLHISQAQSPPYRADQPGTCRNETREYWNEDVELCCSRCPPGQWAAELCSAHADTQCKPCGQGLYIETWNYARKCFACSRCKQNKGLQLAQSCSSTSKVRCKCLPGKYCYVGFQDPYCNDCAEYTPCPAGYGVVQAGTANSNVKCQTCPKGTFSAIVSATEPCRRHTQCPGNATLAPGNSTSDALCDPEPAPLSSNLLIGGQPLASTTPAPLHPPGRTDPPPEWSSIGKTSPTYTSTSALPSRNIDTKLVAAIASTVGVSLLCASLATILLVVCRPFRKKDAAKFPPKVDANGNCKSDAEVEQMFSADTQLTAFTVTELEKHSLMQEGEANTQQSHEAKTLADTEGCSRQDSIGPLLSCYDLQDPPSAVTDSPAPLPSISSLSPQPQMISPTSAGPQVNVNITFHIANGSCGTPPVVPADVLPEDLSLSFGEEEQSSTLPQQEVGKECLLAVDEGKSAK